MSRIRFSQPQVERAARKKLRAKPTGRKEQQYWYILDGVTLFRVTIPRKHSRQSTIPPGTLNSIRRQLHLSREEFAEWVKCPISAEDYAALIREKFGLQDENDLCGQ
jgi:hypothetical protein